MPLDDTRPVNICLYVAIPERDQFRKVRRPPLLRARSAIKDFLNRLLTRLTGNLHLEVYHYWTARNLADNSNRGDIAIRMSIREQLTAAFMPRPVIFREIAWGGLTDEIVTEVNSTSDIFVIGGGGYIFVNGDGSAGDIIVADSPGFAKLTRPIIAFGIGLNRLMHEEVHAVKGLPDKTRELIRTFVDTCASIGVRDRDTRELLELHRDHPVALVGDPVLFMRNPLSRPDRRVAREQTSHLSIGINLAAHSWRAMSMLKPLLPEMVKFLKAIEKLHRIRLVYLLHHDFERPVANYLRQQGIQMDIVDGSTMELLEAYGRLDLIICQMLHSCIFAANAEVPFLNIAYDQKNVSFCELMGIPECCIPHTKANAATLQQRFEEFLRARASVVQTMTERKVALVPENAIFLKELVAKASRQQDHR